MKREHSTEAYDALLTLLKPAQVPKTKKIRPRENTPARPVLAEELQGVLSDEPDQDDDNEMTEQAVVDSYFDDNEGDHTDPFEACYSSDSTTPELSTAKLESVHLGLKCVVKAPVSSSFHAQSLDKLKLKHALKTAFVKERPVLSPFMSELAYPVFNYLDLNFGLRTLANADDIRDSYTLHVLNHILKTRGRILKNNQKLSGANVDTDAANFKDQGFTRPKVLVLLPTRNSAFKFVTRLQKLSGLGQTENFKRFKTSFHDPATPPAAKPADFLDLFSGNTDDLFCLGLKFTRQALKLYSAFYSSDVIVASPLGLKLIIEGSSSTKQKADHDFLSSIEIVVVDQAHAAMLQSWDNVTAVFKHLNLLPKEAHDCDFSRVRSWYIDEQAKHHRQTLVFSQFPFPEINSLFSNYCHNQQGLFKCRTQYSDSVSGINNIGLKIRQTFVRISPASPLDDPDVRFKYFTTTVLPPILRGVSEGTLFFVPSYMDFVRLRNYMDDQNLSCSCLSEYTSSSDVSRARTLYTAGRTKMMIITQRFHHFHRFQIKGVRSLVLYGLPDDPEFYKELVRFLVRTSEETGNTDVSATAIFSKWDALKLEPVVGSRHTATLVRGGDSDRYEFY